VNQDPLSDVNLPESDHQIPFGTTKTQRAHASGVGLAPDDAPVPRLSFTAKCALPITMSHTACWQEQYNPSRHRTIQCSGCSLVAGLSQKGKLTPGVSPTSFPRRRHTKRNHPTFPLLPFPTAADTIAQVPWKDSDTNNQTLEMGKAAIDILVIGHGE